MSFMRNLSGVYGERAAVASQDEKLLSWFCISITYIYIYICIHLYIHIIYIAHVYTYTVYCRLRSFGFQRPRWLVRWAAPLRSKRRGTGRCWFNGLAEAKVYRKTPDFIGKSMVSRLDVHIDHIVSLSPIHWLIFVVLGWNWSMRDADWSILVLCVGILACVDL